MTDDSFTFKKKGILDITQTTTSSIFSKVTNKIKVRTFRKNDDNANNIVREDSNDHNYGFPTFGKTNTPELDDDDDDDNIFAKKRSKVIVKLTIYLWLPKLQYAEEMLLNEERTDLR